MLKRILNSDTAVSLFAKAISTYIKLVHRTSKVITDTSGNDAKIIEIEPFIFAMWHGQTMLTPTVKPAEHNMTVKVIVARHGDGDVISKILPDFGLEALRGAGASYRKKDRGGATVLREALKALKNGETIALTADVPPGPGKRAGDGIVTMARLSGRPIVPCAITTSRTKTLNNWDRFTINLPFSKLALVLGDPIYVPRDVDQNEAEAARKKVEDGLNKVTRETYALLGRTADHILQSPDQSAPAKPGFRLKAYRTLTNVARPLAPLILSQRVRRGKEDPKRQNERLGLAQTARPDGKLFWFHAASVGETNAVLPVINALNASHPSVRILLTTGTVTSAKAAKTVFPQTPSINLSLSILRSSSHVFWIIGDPI